MQRLKINMSIRDQCGGSKSMRRVGINASARDQCTGPKAASHPEINEACCSKRKKWRTMGLIGRWEGIIYYEKLRDFIEDEWFEVKILSLDDKNGIKAVVKEKKKIGSLTIDRGEITLCKAEGRFMARSGKLRLFYKAGKRENKAVFVVLEAFVDKEYQTMKGSYSIKLVTKSQLDASQLQSDPELSAPRYRSSQCLKITTQPAASFFLNKKPL